MVLLNSSSKLPPAWAAEVADLDVLLLTMAMVALGLGTQWSAVKRSGAQPLWLALLLAAWLVVGGGMIHAVVAAIAPLRG